MKELESLYGLLSYFRLFVPEFARITKPISDMKKADATLVWTGEHTAAVEQVIRRLSTEARLRLPDSTQPFVLEVDHGDEGYGGVLLQASGDG
jgi:RNase H-like domain found in reverse transcriptase